MSELEYCVTLCISHPSIEPDEITQSLGIQPYKTRKVGEPFVSSAGKISDKKSKDTYWRAALHEDEHLYSNNISLEDFLINQNMELKKYTKYFEGLVKSGGYVEYFVGLFSDDGLNASITLNPDLLKKTGELNISIGLDIYAFPQNDT